MGYSENDIKEILSGKRLLPGETWDDFSDLGFAEVHKGEERHLDTRGPRREDEKEGADNRRTGATSGGPKTNPHAQRAAGDYLLRSLEEQTNVEREATKLRLEDSMKIIAATNDEAQAVEETAHARNWRTRSGRRARRNSSRKRQREIARLSTRVDEKTGQIRKVTLNKETLDQDPRGHRREDRGVRCQVDMRTRRAGWMRCFRPRWRARRGGSSRACTPGSSRRSGKGTSWRRIAKTLSSRPLRNASGRRWHRSRVWTRTPTQKKLELENAKTAIEKDAIGERTRLEQQEQQMREAAEDRTHQRPSGRSRAAEEPGTGATGAGRCHHAPGQAPRGAVEDRYRGARHQGARQDRDGADRPADGTAGAGRAAGGDGAGHFLSALPRPTGGKIRDLGQQEKDALQKATTSEIDVAQAKGCGRDAQARRRSLQEHLRLAEAAGWRRLRRAGDEVAVRMGRYRELLQDRDPHRNQRRGDLARRRHADATVHRPEGHVRGRRCWRWRDPAASWAGFLASERSRCSAAAGADLVVAAGRCPDR